MLKRKAFRCCKPSTTSCWLRLCAVGIVLTALLNLGLLPHHGHVPRAPEWMPQPQDAGMSASARRNAATGKNTSAAALHIPVQGAPLLPAATRPASADHSQSAAVEALVNATIGRPGHYFSACLLIKDDNAILNEWIAYHYHTLKLRYLVVAVDPSSVTSPTQLLQRWEHLTNLTFLQWEDADYLPQRFLEKGYILPLNRIDGDANHSKWHQGFEDPIQVKRDKQRITTHRYRQLHFLSACYRHLRTTKRRWVLHIDTDEYLSINPMLRARGHHGKIPVPVDLVAPMALFRFLLAIQYRPRLKRAANYPCISLPRLMFGSHVTNDFGRVGGVFDEGTFESLRWKYHTSLTDRVRNALPKVIVDLSAVNETDEMFQNKPFSIHRPSKKLCRFVDQIDFSKTEHFPLTVNHYLGSWERYASRTDSRRSRPAYESKAAVTDGRDDWVSTWLEGFLKHTEPHIARALLQDYIPVPT